MSFLEKQCAVSRDLNQTFPEQAQNASTAHGSKAWLWPTTAFLAFVGLFRTRISPEEIKATLESSQETRRQADESLRKGDELIHEINEALETSGRLHRQ